jgi:hypothetical protein
MDWQLLLSWSYLWPKVPNDALWDAYFGHDLALTQIAKLLPQSDRDKKYGY